MIQTPDQTPHLEGVAIPDEYRSALLSLKRPDYFRARKHLGDLIIDREGANPELADMALAVIKEFHRHEIPFRVFDIFRGREEQELYFARGTSKARFGQSAHNFGLAVDLIHATRAWNMTKEEWQLLATVTREVARRKKISLTWGGDWSFYDPAHFEVLNWKELVRAR